MISALKMNKKQIGDNITRALEPNSKLHRATDAKNS